MQLLDAMAADDLAQPPQLQVRFDGSMQVVGPFDSTLAIIVILAAIRSTPDIYLQAADRAELVNLHASAQVGQRVRGENGWPDYQWWNHEGWYSPVVPFIRIRRDGETALPQFKHGVPRDVRIHRANFGAYPWRVMFVIGGERDVTGLRGASPRMRSRTTHRAGSCWAAAPEGRIALQGKARMHPIGTIERRLRRVGHSSAR